MCKGDQGSAFRDFEPVKKFYYYSTQPFLAWCLNRFFFAGKHYVWASTHFYPYRLLNPKSSNPYLVYKDLYDPWKDNDVHDKTVAQFRLNLLKGVFAHEKSGVLTAERAKRLKRICTNVDIRFLYPIVYRIEVTNSIVGRHVVAGSGTQRSSEYLIRDLDESEFDILFLDSTGDLDLDGLEYLANQEGNENAKASAMLILELRSKSRGTM